MGNFAVADLGFAQMKIATSKEEVVLPTGLVEIAPAEYEKRVKLAGGEPGPDFIRVNGVAYVVGKTAEAFGVTSKPGGAARYTRAYYGVLAAAMLARAYQRSSDDVTLMLSHPPADVDYTDDLMNAVLGQWNVEIDGDERHYIIRAVHTFDEPLGGLMNRVLNDSGTDVTDTSFPINDFGLLIDVGGHTIGGLSAAPGGRPDYSVIINERTGIADALTSFLADLRANNRALFKTTPTLRDDRIRQALASGIFKIGDTLIPCENEARRATSVLLNTLANTIQEKAGGVQRWDYFVLSGGGSGLLGKRIQKEVLENRQEVYLAAPPKVIHLANMRGGVKIAKALGLVGASYGQPVNSIPA